MADYRNRQQANPFVTTAFSDYTREYPGDTVEQRALLYASKAEAYDKGYQGYVNQSEVFDKIPHASFQNKYIEGAAKDFDEKFEYAKEQGDFEDRIRESGEVAKTVADKWSLNDVSTDYQKYTEDVKSWEELPTDFKELSMTEQAFINSGELEYDEKGNPKYKRYKSPKELFWVDYSKEMDGIIKGWEADGWLQWNKETNSYDISTDLVLGQSTLIKSKGISKQEVFDFIVQGLQNNPNYARSINSQAYVKVMQPYYAKKAKGGGDYNIDDFENLLRTN